MIISQTSSPANVTNPFNKAKRKKSLRPIKKNKEPLQTVYLEKDIVKNKLPSIGSKNSGNDDDNKKTCNFSSHSEKSFNIRTVGGGGNKKMFKKGKKYMAYS